MKFNKYDASEVRGAAEGNWYAIISQCAAGFEDAISKGSRRHTWCPFHQAGMTSRGGAKPDFRFDREGSLKGSAICSCGSWKDGFSLLMDYNGWNFAETLANVAEVCGVRPIVEGDVQTNKPKVNAARAAWAAKMAKKQALELEKWKRYQAKLPLKLRTMWEESVTLFHPSAVPARAYLEKRGIRHIPNGMVRYHASLPYYDGDQLVGRFPAIVGLVQTPTGHFGTLHLTYLTPDGEKAVVPDQKKLCPVPDAVDLKGSAIRCTQPAIGILGVAEGLETALSAWYATGIPTWSTINAYGLASFEPPPGVHTIIIWIDRDKSRTGQEAAKALIERLSNHPTRRFSVLPMMPKLPFDGRKSVDWNDVLVTQGTLGFPVAEQILQDIPEYLFEPQQQQGVA